MSATINKLLERQIKKVFRDAASIPEGINPLLQAVSDAYDGFDEDRKLIERAFDLSSQELILANKRLQQREKQERLILSISTAFINLPHEDIGAGFQHMLKVVGEFADVDRSYIFQFHDDGVQMDNTHEWCAPGVAAQIQTLKNIDINQELPWFIQEARHKSVINIPNVSELPSEAYREKNHFQRQGILSLVVVPSFINNEMVGFIGFDAVRTMHKWDEDLIALLQIVATIFANTIERQKAELALKESHNKLKTALAVSETLRKDLVVAREQAEASARSKSVFLANMSHEIRTPMNTILGFSRLQKRFKLNPTQRRYLDLIISSGDYLLDLLNNILDLSKAEADKIILEQVDFNLANLVEDVLGIVQSRVGDKKVDLTLEIKKDVPLSLNGDPTRLRQILINLLGNALKFTDQGKVGLVISHEADNQENGLLLRFLVQDTGVGIPESQRDIIFDMFTQGDSSTTRKWGGTGLGLAICKRYVGLMGGKIWVESKVGRGSKFIFTAVFRRMQDPIEDDAKPIILAPLMGKKILLLGYDKKSQDILSIYCQEMGFRLVHRSNSPEEAFAWLSTAADDKKLFPDMAFINMFMPEVKGVSFAKKIKHAKKCRDIKTVALTSKDKIGDPAISKKNGFDCFLAKPFTRRELLGVVLTVLGENRQKGKGAAVSRLMPEDRSCKGLNVLVVEDNIPNQQLIKGYLSVLGCKGDYVSDGMSAIGEIKTKKYNLCFMDIHIPGISGIEVARAIRQNIDKNLPIIALTADITVENKTAILASGMNDYILKPVPLDVLKAKIYQHTRAVGR